MLSNDRSASRIPLPALHSFCRDVLIAAGLPSDSAGLISDSLTGADARGLSSHGAARLLPVYVRRLAAGTTRARPNLRIERRRGNVALVDGDSGAGQVVGSWAMGLAIELAREAGAGVVGVRRSSHFGTSAFFVEQAAAAGMIGIALTNAPSNMPPAGGRSKYFGTNPLAIGFPGGEDAPVVLDMSTSVVARGKIVMAHKAGEPIPPGWAIDEDGNPTQDTAAALRGAVLPMAGYKGAGLALMIDVLCGVLTGAAFGRQIVDLYDEGEQQQNVGHFFVAVDIDTLMPLELFRARMAEFAAEVRAQPRLPGVERIYLPGEPEQAKSAEAARHGVLLPEASWLELDELARRYDVTPLAERLEKPVSGAAL